MLFVETAGVSFGLPVIPIIVKQKDARVQTHIYKRKEQKKEISVSPSQHILVRKMRGVFQGVAKMAPD